MVKNTFFLLNLQNKIFYGYIQSRFIVGMKLTSEDNLRVQHTTIIFYLLTANCIPECENGGICIRNSICQCPPGWSGGRCQTGKVKY